LIEFVKQSVICTSGELAEEAKIEALLHRNSKIICQKLESNLFFRRL